MLEEMNETQRLWIRLFMRISELVLLVIAVYLAATIYQYRDGWNAGIDAMKAQYPCISRQVWSP